MGITIRRVGDQSQKEVTNAAIKVHNAKSKSKAPSVEEPAEVIGVDGCPEGVDKSECCPEDNVVENVDDAPVEEEAPLEASTEDLEASLREDLAIHTKSGLGEYARKNLDLEIDRRKSKSVLIDTIVEASIK